MTIEPFGIVLRPIITEQPSTKLLRADFDENPKEGKMKIGKLLGGVAVCATIASGAFAQDWGGFYAGLSASSGTSEVGGPILGGLTFSGSATAPGIFVGYNHVLSNNMVLGAELSYEGVDSSIALSGGGTIAELNSQAMLRARLGFASGNVMPYVTAGITRGDFDVPTSGFSSSESGYNVGFGLEYMFSNNMSARVEYGVTKYDSVFEPLAPPDAVDATHKAVTVGMAWHF